MQKSSLMKRHSHILVVNSRVVTRPLFVVGAPHSGVEAVARALSRSPGLYLTAGHPAVLRAGYALARRPSMARERRVGTAEMLREAFAEAWQLTEQSCPECSQRTPRQARGPANGEPCRHGRGVRRFGDAGPDLLYSAEALAETFPDARFVQVIRDGRDAVSDMLSDDTLLAWFRPEMLSAAPEVPNPFFGFETEKEREAYPRLADAARCALRWRSAVRLSAKLRAELAPERVLTLRHEEIRGGEVAAAERLTEFTGCTCSAVELLDGTPAGVGIWRRALTREQLRLVGEAAGTELERLGYLG